ncbi:hypothetical protein FNU76_15705 [Chitinimonas arctica]|uniref:Uncharacterized protein n=1 Tax=Chitinimonas arctica TaxID=2594795 RepID=A0A516SHP8_9NEIS|nr:hypothetical protein [Chitinimonas arctica]QDQ27677.1 hypothetical protein FNU76_15705 [Chitinimonas arctica]
MQYEFIRRHIRVTIERQREHLGIKHFTYLEMDLPEDVFNRRCVDSSAATLLDAIGEWSRKERIARCDLPPSAWVIAAVEALESDICLAWIMVPGAGRDRPSPF